MTYSFVGLGNDEFVMKSSTQTAMDRLPNKYYKARYQPAIPIGAVSEVEVRVVKQPLQKTVADNGERVAYQTQTLPERDRHQNQRSWKTSGVSRGSAAAENTPRRVIISAKNTA